MPEKDILEAITLFKTAFDEWKQIEEVKHEGSEARLHVIEGKVQESGEVSSARLAAIEDKMKDSVETSGSRGIKAVHFSGAESEDVNEFIIRFAQMGTFYKWEEARMLAALPLYLTGNATAWYNTCAKTPGQSLQDILKALTKQFDPSTNRWLLRQKLDKRNQGTTESLDEYTTDIRRLCQRLELPKSEWLHSFMRGLRPSIRNYVYLQQPNNFEEAENLARLRSSVSDTEPQVATLINKFGNVVDDLKQLVTEQNRPGAGHIAAFSQPNGQNYSSPGPRYDPNLRTRPEPGRGQPLYKDDLVYAINELKRDIFRSRPNNNRSFNSNRNRRTPTGVPICNSCGRPGHISIRCRSRDPRIPDQNRGRQNAGFREDQFPQRNARNQEN